MIHTLFVLFILSLGLSEWGSKNYPTLNFYILPTRGWELLAGSILAYFSIFFIKKKKEYKSSFSLFTFIGFCLIFLSFIFYDEELLNPSLITLFPVLGVSLIIWFANKRIYHKNSLNQSSCRYWINFIHFIYGIIQFLHLLG